MENKEYYSNLITKAKAGYDTYSPYFVDFYKAYQALLDEKAVKYLESKGKSNIPFYYIMNKLQRIRADFIEAYFTNKQFAKISEKPTLKGTYFNSSLNQFVPFMRHDYSNMHYAAVKALQNAVDYYTIDDETCNLFSALSVAFDDLKIYGTVAIKITWDNGIKIESIDINKIYYDPGAKNVENIKYLVHEIDITVEEIIEYQQQGIFNNDIDLEQIAPDYQNNKHKRICLQEIYEKKQGSWYVTTMWDKNIILRENANLPFGCPIVIGTIKNQKISPDGDENAVRVYGDSIIAPLMPLQREMTILRNQQLDIVDRQLNPRYIIGDKNINPFDFTNQKQTVIQGNGEKVKELQTPNTKESIFNVDRLSVEGQEAIGVTDYNSGNSNNKQLNSTATGISILTSESNKILAHYLRATNETLIKPLFRKITELVWAYGDARFFYGVDRSIELEYAVGVDVGLGATNKEQQLNSKMAAYNGMIALAGQFQDPIRLERAEKFYYKEILPLMGVENYEEYMNEQRGFNQEFGGVANNTGMGVPNNLLGTAENRLTASGIAREDGN